ncbi:MAG TPA: hypothetical protein VMY05_03785 [Acidobacteriota bacterium]|nr:hypothetical protein [Acidobacteriota bacterium]
MDTNAITQLEQGLIAVLKKEYSFYQSLYILLDKQRDVVKYDKDENLLDLYAEIERCQCRIRESEAKITAIRETSPQLFRVASVHPEVKRLVNCIITLVKKNIRLVAENEQYARDRHERIRAELEELRSSQKILQYMGNVDPLPHFVDGKS